MYQKLSIFQPTIFLTLCLLLTLNARSAFAENAPTTPDSSYLIQEIKYSQQGDAVTLEIAGNHTPVYTQYDLPNPARLIIDIADGTFDKKINPDQIIPDNNYAKVTGKNITDKKPQIARLEITIKETHTYSVDRDKNNLLILIHPKADNAQAQVASVPKETPAPALTATPETAPMKPGASTDPTLSNLIDSSTTALNKGKAKEQTTVASATGSPDGSFDFGGYKGNKRISVDFFKIDLHNVFRLFRDVSGVNIIVDEAVKGSLTLALNDVPWDFALDIILNLKDLRKEERFNTIVIYPAEKAFVWPERAQDNLTVEADLEIVQQEKEALLIEQSAAQSEEFVQSKEFIRKGRIEEKNDNIEKAVDLYEQAFKLDPKNSQLANRLASLYLANLGVNPKAVYFAKESLKAEPKNTQAALYAAIGLANMNQIPEATDYFMQSISGQTPMKEALLSYAAFSEQNGQGDGALKLIARYNTLYGESVDTMVSKARIYDKMGQKEKANEQYRALLASGYQLVPGLKEYIQSRLSGNAAPASKPL
jgi:type IV pilus assembly protein PilQ